MEADKPDANAGSSYNTFSNPPDDVGDGQNKTQDFTVSEAIETIGFGRFQILIGLASGLAWIADGMEIMVISILGPTLVCEWGITTVQEALLTTVVFAGFFFGSPAFGYLADQYGRRKSIFLASAWIAFYGVLSAVSPLLGWLYFLRAMVGFGVGGGQQACTYLAEFLPVKARVGGIMFVEVFFAMGAAFEVVLAILILVPYGWQWWLVTSAVPSMIYLILSYWLPTTPRYCMASGNPKEAMETLELAARMNRVTLPAGKLMREPLAPRGRIMDLLAPRFRKSSILLAILWFVAGFSYYGVVLFSTEMISIGTTCDPDGFSNDTDIGCDVLTTDDYISLLWTSFAELPGLLIGVVLIETVGRRIGLTILYSLFCITCFLLFICMSTTPMVVVLFICRAFATAAFQVLFVYTPEVYPTEVRALSLGVGSSFGRLGALSTPYVAEVLLNISLWYGLGVYGCIGAIAAIFSFFLPVETKGRALREAADEDSSLGGPHASSKMADMNKEN